MSRTSSPLRDRELLEMLADEPELLAIADAFAETQHEKRSRTAVAGSWKPLLAAAVVTVALAGAGVGIAAGFGVFHSAHDYSARQVEQAFASQGIRLRDVSPKDYHGLLVLLDGRPAHAVYVYVEVGKFSGALRPALTNANQTHHGNVDVLWRRGERSAVRAALHKLN